MSIRNKPMYPYEFGTPGNRGNITYREWLVGQLATNPALIKEGKVDTNINIIEKVTFKKQTAIAIVELADRIIEELDNKP